MTGAGRATLAGPHRPPAACRHPAPGQPWVPADWPAAAGAPVADLALRDRYAAMNAHHGVETWAPNYAGLGRDDLTPAVLRERLATWTATLVAEC